MADIAKAYKDKKLYNACKNIFENIVTKKMYITGGIGATCDGEAFSFNYDLPNDLAYSETCAAIGLIFFCRRMLEIKADSIIADTMERALYNNVLAGIGEDGKHFFYANPLEVLPEASYKDSRKRHIKPQRQKWFGCACCPPNIARLISSIGEYCCTENEDTVYVHQFMGGEFKTEKGYIEIQSNYSSDGTINLRISPCKGFSLAIRIPGWCNSFFVSKDYELKNGYAYFRIEEETEISVKFETEPQIIKCSNRVRANIGKVAVTKGPFVYCIEEADNGNNLQQLIIDKSPEFSVAGDFIFAKGYREKDCPTLYSKWKEAELEEARITFVPYYKWGNRGENEMSVYIRI